MNKKVVFGISLACILVLVMASMEPALAESTIGMLRSIRDLIMVINAKLNNWFDPGGTYSTTAQIKASSGHFESESTGTGMLLKRVEASGTVQFVITSLIDVVDANDKLVIRATFDGTTWLTLEELTSDGYITLTIAARGVEILYDDTVDPNVAIDWGITVTCAPEVTIEWT